ncbi:MAG TPA: aspartyl protease family protein [Steroidobacteraceae bacterium]|nr:aspartyl protease family protein [Steroidobacteraceae bacterium]
MAICAVLPAGWTAYAADKKCTVSRILELPITMNSLRPTIPVKINNRDAKFVLDSGAFYSIMSSATAAEYNLKLKPAPFGFRIIGIGGSAEAKIATVKEFTIVGITIKNVEFLVGGSEVAAYEGLLGQNLLEKFDVEYDLATGAIRLFRTEGCEHALLAYWLKPGQDYSSMHIDAIDPANPHTIGVAYVNGQSIRVAFDTGAFTSLLSTKAAARAGIKPDSEGVIEAGDSGGLGRGRVKTYIARFASFKIGDSEEIKNARLRIADMDLGFADMLLGADFFVSHRIFVANREHKLFLSYNGGPVFNLSKGSGAATAANTTEPSDAHDDGLQPSTDAPASAKDAALIARRGSALAARRDFAAALADLSKAIELSPNEPEYYFERANAYWANGQADLALADFDHVILLKNDFLPVYLPRAELHLREKDKAAAMTDLNSLDRLAPPQADLRFSLAELYRREEQFLPAIAQYDLWIKNHPDDSRMVSALGGRCLAKALQNQDLDGGLRDCNTAIRLADKKNPANAHLYSNRGMILLRQGDYRRALADFEADLKIEPKSARALYGRGVAKARMNKRVEGDEDIAAAETLAPQVGERYGRYGIIP